MFAYIVRRLLWAVLLLIVLSMSPSRSYLIPRLGGAPSETLATRYVGRAATAGRST